MMCCRCCRSCESLKVLLQGGMVLFSEESPSLTVLARICHKEKEKGVEVAVAVVVGLLLMVCCYFLVFSAEIGWEMVLLVQEVELRKRDPLREGVGAALKVCRRSCEGTFPTTTDGDASLLLLLLLHLC